MDTDLQKITMELEKKQLGFMKDIMALEKKIATMSESTSRMTSD